MSTSPLSETLMFAGGWTAGGNIGAAKKPSRSCAGSKFPLESMSIHAKAE
jgi:hypothetical protein